MSPHRPLPPRARSPIAALVELSRSVADTEDPAVVARLLGDAAELWLGAAMAVVFVTGDTGGMAVAEARGAVPTEPCDDPLDPDCWTEASGLAVRVLPLASGGNLFGALVVGWPAPETEQDASELAEALVDIAAVGLDRAFRTRALVQSLRDLADNRQELARTEGLRRMGQMAAVVAHEVRNPLASIGGVLQVLHGRSAPGSQEHVVMGKVLDRLSDLNRLVDELLQFARPAPPTHQPVELSAFLTEVVAQATADPMMRDARVVLDLATVVWPIDRSMIHRLVLNLLINAAQAAHADSPVRIEVGCRSGEGGTLALWVADDGPGIPEDVRARIFEPFVTTKVRGTGLGLAVAKQIVEAHAGTIAYRDGPSGGARFEVTLRPTP